MGERRAALVSGIVQAGAGVGDCLMSPGLQALISNFGIRAAMSLITIPFFIMIPIALWIGSVNKEHISEEKKEAAAKTGLISMLGEAFKDRDYRLILISFGTCGFNMSIIESHIFSQFVSNGISETAASFALMIYGIATMTGAAASGFLGIKFKMKNVLGTVYGLRVIISAGFLLLPKTPLFAFVSTALLGLSGDSTVPPTTGIISRKFGAEKMAVLYGFALIGHQAGAFLSAYLGGVFIKAGLGYSPLWTVNLFLAAIASASAFSIHSGKAQI
ncbi:MAG: hypothetical protein LUD81_09210 [Clostridiales bacterium]|nr:hypothetical protein [Clostridiales bacterium]